MNRLRRLWQEMNFPICPTCVGMNRSDAAYADEPGIHLPHMRGDEPGPAARYAALRAHLPHMRGDEPWATMPEVMMRYICPTCVGMNRMWRCMTRSANSICPTCVGMNRAVSR